MSVYQRQESPYWYYQFKIRKQRYRGPTKEPERGLAEADERAMRQNINDESGLTTPPMNEVLKRYLIAMGERIMQGQEAILNRVAALEHDVKALRCDFDALKDELRKEDGDQVDRIAGGTLKVLEDDKLPSKRLTECPDITALYRHYDRDGRLLYVEAETNAPPRGLLVPGGPYYEAWQAEIDEERTELARHPRSLSRLRQSRSSAKCLSTGTQSDERLHHQL